MSKLKELILCLKAGRVTLPYPLVEIKPAPGFRGRPAIDGTKCLGCGACAAVCPPRLIHVTDQDGQRKLSLDYSRCTYCARCQEICPAQAIKLTPHFELATENRGDLQEEVGLKLVSCQICGRPFITQRLLHKMVHEFSPEWSPVKEDPPRWFWWCPECRKTHEGRNMKVGFEHV